MEQGQTDSKLEKKDTIEKEYFAIGNEIGRLAEKSELIEKFTTLNDNFTKHLKDEKMRKCERKTSEKQPTGKKKYQTVGGLKMITIFKSRDFT